MDDRNRFLRYFGGQIKMGNWGLWRFTWRIQVHISNKHQKQEPSFSLCVCIWRANSIATKIINPVNRYMGGMIFLSFCFVDSTSISCYFLFLANLFPLQGRGVVKQSLPSDHLTISFSSYASFTFNLISYFCWEECCSPLSDKHFHTW